MIDTSVIISVYNDAAWLAMIFAALERQTAGGFEVVVADDGSGASIAETISEADSKYRFPIKHVWHDDRGWRKNAILNKAVVAAEGEYLIFIDGDCIPHYKFIEEHRLLRERGQISAGRRAQLPPEVSESLTPDKILRRRPYYKGMFFKALWYGIKDSRSYGPEYYVRITAPWMRKRMKKRTHGVLGCNMGIYKDDILKVNGFDERFEMAYVGEDTDLEARLVRAGIKVRVFNHIASMYHKWHRSQPPDKDRNMKLYEENNRLGVGYTPYGIDKTQRS